MARIEKTVFVSYRRADEPWALAVFGDLTHHGYDVFVDYDGIASGNFETAILENIKARAHFLVLLTPAALERCSDPEDWMRREIEAALDSHRNIVPLMLEGFTFGSPTIADRLTGKLAALKQYNGLQIPEGYFPQAMGRLRDKFLNVPVDAVLHSASVSAQQAATEQKDKAARALTGEEPKRAEDATARKRADQGPSRSWRDLPAWQLVSACSLVSTLPFFVLLLSAPPDDWLSYYFILACHTVSGGIAGYVRQRLGILQAILIAACTTMAVFVIVAPYMIMRTGGYVGYCYHVVRYFGYIT
jgi:hypothetical protein